MSPLITRRAGWIGAAGLVLSVALAACSSDETAVVLTCPQVLVVDEASRLTLHAPGEGREAQDVRFEAVIGQARWACEFFPEAGRIEVRVSVDMAALRGPAAEGPVAELPYFVAVAAPDGAILAKRTFAATLEFQEDATEAGHVETVVQRFRYARISEAAAHTIYLGYQLTPEQLEEARAG